MSSPHLRLTFEDVENKDVSQYDRELLTDVVKGLQELSGLLKPNMTARDMKAVKDYVDSANLWWIDSLEEDIRRAIIEHDPQFYCNLSGPHGNISFCGYGKETVNYKYQNEEKTYQD